MGRKRGLQLSSGKRRSDHRRHRGFFDLRYGGSGVSFRAGGSAGKRHWLFPSASGGRICPYRWQKAGAAQHLQLSGARLLPKDGLSAAVCHRALSGRSRTVFFRKRAIKKDGRTPPFFLCLYRLILLHKFCNGTFPSAAIVVKGDGKGPQQRGDQQRPENAQIIVGHHTEQISQRDP